MSVIDRIKRIGWSGSTDPNDPLDGPRVSERVAVNAHDQIDCRKEAWPLCRRHVDAGFRLLLVSTLDNVPDDTNDGEPRLGRVEPDSSAERRLSRHELPDERFVDDNGERCVSAIARVEETPLDWRHSKRLQIVGRADADECVPLVFRKAADVPRY